MANLQDGANRHKWSMPRPEDIVYFGILLSLMSGSAAFPFYVHFHRDEFGPPTMEFYGAQEKAENPESNSSIYQRKIVAFVKPRLEVDQLTTGTIFHPSNPGAVQQEATPRRQPFPGDEMIKATPLEIIFVGLGRVLALDLGKVVTLREGSSLSDGSRIKAIERTKGGWRVITSAGRTILWSDVR